MHGISEYLQAFSTIFVGFSVLVASSQLRLHKKQIEITNKWNKKEAAIKALHEYPKAIKDSRLYLNKHLKVNFRIEKNKNFTIAEIHNELGVFLQDGCFVFHGEQTQKDIQNCRQSETKPNEKEYITQFDENKNGRETYNHIINLLNEHEYLAMACNKDIFDKETVIELKGTGFIAVFNLFANYIYHLRYDDRHGRNERLYIHLENFAKDVEDILKKKGVTNIRAVLKPQEKDYSTPFKRC